MSTPKKLNYHPNKTTNYLFCFLEVFTTEGGIQSYIQDILNAYEKLATKTNSIPKAQILLLRDTPTPPNLEHSKALKFYYLKTNPASLGRIKFTIKLIHLLIQEKPKMVFCGHIKLAPLIQTICKFLAIPYTVITYGKEIWNPLTEREKKALREADRIWTISRYTRDRACKINHLDPQKFEILPCTVNGNIFTPGPKPQSLIERYNLSNAKVLMTVARLWSGDIYKGVDVTIRALPLIAQVFPNVKYLVIGRGDDRTRLAKLAEDLGVEDRVIFAGFVAKEELVEHYRVADGYVMPSQEGFGIVYLEAIACGLPVVAGDDDGSADPLQDGMLGWQVPYRDAVAVAAACVEMLRGEDRRCDRDWLREKTLTAFGTDTFLDRVKQLLNL
ncbi:glycosyl transferase group 1 [Oscillatoriales cyanobacterium USR001]|nr:glycosyl transferase group 1 [Oscillatoriales cyanobacterium USR001]